MLKSLLLTTWFKLFADGNYLSNNHPPGSIYHSSGVISKSNGEIIVKNFYGKTVLRFASIKALYCCIKSRRYQFIFTR